MQDLVAAPMEQTVTIPMLKWGRRRCGIFFDFHVEIRFEEGR